MIVKVHKKNASEVHFALSLKTIPLCLFKMNQPFDIESQASIRDTEVPHHG